MPIRELSNVQARQSPSRSTALCCAAALLGLGFVSRLGFGFEWDELELLHGAWAIGQGALPYRDFFEHHPPLLHFLIAPFVATETTISWRLLLEIRLVALIVVVAICACFGGLVRRAGASLLADWALVALLVVCPLSGKLFELRPDWLALLCLLASLLLISGERSTRWPALLLAGVLGGLAICLTQKTAPLWLAALVASVVWRRSASVALWLAGGTLLPIVTVVLFFAHRGSAAALYQGVIGVNLGWPREVDWRSCLERNSLAVIGPFVLTLVHLVRQASRRSGRTPAARTVVIAVALAGVVAYVATPAPWEQSLLFFVVPWVSCLAMVALNDYVTAPMTARRDGALLAVVLLALAASLPAARAGLAIATCVIVALASWQALRSNAPTAIRAQAAWIPILLPGVILFTKDRLADLRSGRWPDQQAFAHTLAQHVAPDGEVLALWDHVLPFRPAPTRHWFAHAGVLQRFVGPGTAATALDEEYLRAVTRRRVPLIVADPDALAMFLPRLDRFVHHRCRLAVQGYEGSNGYACTFPGTPTPANGPSRPNMPNVVLVVIDTLRADHVSAYGYARETTPTLDHFAAEGVRFDSAVSQAPWTAASVASLLTGLYPSVHGIDSGVRWRSVPGKTGLPFIVQKRLEPADPTLATILRAYGYRTAGFVSNVYMSAAFGFNHGFDRYEDDCSDYVANVRARKRRGEQTNRSVFEWLDAGIEEPFFLLVHYNDPHWPYDPPPPFGTEWTGSYRGPLLPTRTGFVVENEGRPMRGLDAADVAYLVGLYDGEVRYADANLGSLLARLRSTSLSRPMLTVVTADHGEEFVDHGSTSHGYTLYDEQIHVPLVMHFPGRIRPGHVASQVRLVDVLPTVLDLVGIDRTGMGLQGTSVVSLLDRPSEAGSRDAFSEATLHRRLTSLRTADGIKVIAEGSRIQVFDIKRDPGERLDIASRPGLDLDALTRRVVDWRGNNVAVRRNRPRDGDSRVQVDESARARLHALGYLSGGLERDAPTSRPAP